MTRHARELMPLLKQCCLWGGKMTNIRLDITYDGTDYSGFQIQENAPTIQGEIERALAIIYKQPVRLAGAGRTDAGVHARGQVAAYSAPFEVFIDRLPAAINSSLPAGIVVTGASPVPPGFHPRFDAVRKIYSYTIDRDPYPRVMLRRYSLHHPGPLNLHLMRHAAISIQGKHDFKVFQASGGTDGDTVRTLFRVELREDAGERLLRLTFEGDGFLYRMVRLITGSLLRVGRAQLDPGDLLLALQGEKPDVAGPTAPPQGLCLEKVIYDEENR